MGNVLLVTTDRRLIAEFETLAAATGIAIDVEPHVPDQTHAGTVFIDASANAGTLRHHNTVVVTMAAPGPSAWSLAAAVTAVRIAELPRDREWVTAHIHTPAVTTGTVVALRSAVGGAGATTLAIALAHHVAKRGQRTALVDLDPDGGLDIVAGLEGTAGPRWPDVDLAALSGADLAQWLPTIGEVAVLSSDLRRPQAVTDPDVVAALAQTCDVVVLDVPTAGANGVLAGITPDIDCTVLPNTVRAVSVAGRRVTARSPRTHGLVVRSINGAGLDPMAIAEVLDTPLWACLPTDARVVEQVEQGLGPSTISLGGYTRAVLHLANRVLGDDASTVA